MLLKLVPDRTQIDFMRMRRLLVTLSLFMILCSFLLVFFRGLNFGIDFKGGILVELRLSEKVSLEDIRLISQDLGRGEVTIQEFGEKGNILIRAENPAGDEKAQMMALDSMKSFFIQKIPGVEFRRTEVIGPKVSADLKWKGAVAVTLAILGILAYVWLRFEWQFSVSALLALIHDVALTLGVFSLFRIDFTLSIVAAILTIIGYSLNDTVVVFDRVRENLRKTGTLPLSSVLNSTVNETLSRTIMTSMTTLIALVALYTLGSESLRGFSFAMIWGVVVGTYSSIYIASPVLLWLDVRGNNSFKKKE